MHMCALIVYVCVRVHWHQPLNVRRRMWFARLCRCCFYCSHFYCSYFYAAYASNLYCHCCHCCHLPVPYRLKLPPLRPTVHNSAQPSSALPSFLLSTFELLLCLYACRPHFCRHQQLFGHVTSCHCLLLLQRFIAATHSHIVLLQGARPFLFADCLLLTELHLLHMQNCNRTPWTDSSLASSCFASKWPCHAIPCHATTTTSRHIRHYPICSCVCC